MKETCLQKLKQLQEIDREILGLERKQREYPHRLDERRGEVDRTRRKVDEVKKQVMDHKARADRRELDLKTREGEIAKLEVQLNTVKTNAEFHKIRAQIESIKADNSLLEEEIIELMTQVDELQKVRAECEKEMAAEEARFQDFARKIEGEMKSLEESIAGVRDRRHGAAQDIDRDTLQTYGRILERKGDTAMALVKDQVCQECNMAVTTHDLTRVINGEDLVLCKFCSRILFVERTPRPS